MNIVVIKPPAVADQLIDAWKIRTIVFVGEQGVPAAMEIDGADSQCIHIIVKNDNQPVATARIRHTSEGYKFERFAVLKEYRSRKLGDLLVKTALGLVPEQEKIYLHAQVQVIGFYKKYNFEVIGDEFEEAGIKHVKMLFQQ